MISRREFVKIGAAVGAGVMLPAGMVAAASAFNPGNQPAPANPLRLTKYVDTMPIMGLMPAAAQNYYRVGVYQFKSKVHSQMQPTTAWGYRPLGFVPSLTRPEATWLAPSFAFARGTTTKVEWLNKLNGIKHPLPVDPSLMIADPMNNKPPMGTVYPVDAAGLTTFDYTLNTVPIITHMHGGEQPPCSDGGPFGWFTPGFAQTGPEWANSGDVDPNFAPTGKHNVYPYPNRQLPATIWYHDHALGLDRLNVYMGMAGACVIYDTALEPGFTGPVGTGLPSILNTLVHGIADKFGQPYDIPIVIQDRVFDAKGQLWYPGRQGTNPDVHPFWVPEFFGDTICVNGTAWPKLRVEPRKYRFRVLDGSNARFYNLTLWNQTDNVNGPGITVVAGDQGYLKAPAPYAPGVGLTIAPGERMEVIVDFAGFAGKNILMRNDAPSPFPLGAPVDPTTTGQIMQFQVDSVVVADNSTVPAVLNTIFGAPLATFPSIGGPGVGVAPIKTRQLTLNEVQGPGGPFQVVENYTSLDLPTTENPKVGTTEIWRIVNMTVDAHPIHLHGSSFQIKSRQPFLHETDPALPGYALSYDRAWAVAYGLGFDLVAPFAPIIPPEPTGPPLAYNLPGTVLTPGDGSTLIGGNPDVTPFLTGVPAPPAADEIGWKDTAKMLPGEVTELVVRIAPNDGTATFPYDATAPLGYVWHCHILEHEENDMMRRSIFLP